MSIKDVAIEMIEKFEEIEQLNELITNDEFIQDIRALPADDRNEIDVAVSLENLNLFNHIIFVQLSEYFVESVNCKEFDNSLRKVKWTNEFITVKEHFININKTRNERTYAHPYDKKGNMSIKIEFLEFKEFIQNEIEAVNEICSYFKNV